MKQKLDDYRCDGCSRIVWRWVFRDVKYRIKCLPMRFKKCQKCGKRGVYEKDDGKWLCFDCYTDVTGLPF